MALNANRTDFIFNHADQFDQYGASVGDYTIVQQNFDSRAEENLTDINNIKDTLKSTNDGDSGADNVYATSITNLDGNTVQAILESLRNQLKSVADGASGADFIAATSISGITGNTVQSILENISTLVNQAVATSGSAESKADSAVATANTADENATTALNTANAALGQNTVEPYTGALGAMKIATDVQTDYETQKPLILQAVEDAENAVSSVAGKADVAYVDSVAAGFVLGTVPDGTITDAKLSNTAGQIKPRVADLETNQGALASLTTTEKTNLVGAINEVDGDLAAHKASIGAANGIAELDATGKVPLAQLPDISGVSVFFATTTLLSTNWTGSAAPYSLALSVVGILATDKPVIDIDLSSASDYLAELAIIDGWTSNVYRAICTADTITFYASGVPSVDIPINLQVVRS